MLGYSSIDITNFRGIKHLSLNNLSSFNIFTGRNNSGKSTCLEAITLLSSGNKEFKNIFGEDALKFVTFRRGKEEIGWNYLIGNEIGKASITGTRITQKGGETEGVIIGSTLSDLQLDRNDVLLELLNEQMVGERRIISERGVRWERRVGSIKNSLYFYYNGGHEKLACLFGDGKNTDSIVVGKKTRNPLEPLDVLFIGNFEDIQAELHDKSVVDGRLFDVIHRLNQKFTDIQDLRRIGDKLFIFYKNGKHIPLATMGDGFKVSLLVTLSAQTITGGVLILEEPENFLHPGLMMHLVEELMITAKEHGLQIFTSTHSEEFLRFCLERAGDLSVSIIKMNRIDGNFEANIMPKEEALKKINDLGLDLRGF